MYDIFLSYATSDRDRLIPLVDALERQGWTIFWDHRSIKVAQEWHEVIETAIQQSTCVIVAWSEDSVNSKWVKEEALIARDRGVLYPILIDSVTLPFGFNLIQAADFTSWDEKTDHQEYVELSEQLSICLDSPPHRPSTQQFPESLPTITSGLTPPLHTTLKGNGFGFKSAGVMAILAVIGLAGHQLFQPSEIPDEDKEEIAAKEPLLANVDKASEPGLHKTYKLTITVAPNNASVTINGKAYQKEQKLAAGTYTIQAKAEHYKPVSGRVVISDRDREATIRLERERLPFEPVMVEIPGGSFLMGCDLQRDDVEGGCKANEKPPHAVVVSPFLLAKTEVTVGQFRAFVASANYVTTAETSGSCWSYTANEKWENMRGNSWRKPGFKQNDNHPAVCVSWHDATAYIKWLNSKTGKPWRLPTETEWEYAARAKTNTAYSWGNAIGNNKANCWKSRCEDSFRYTAPTSSFTANPFGLFDMNGNAWEWVADRWHSNYKGAPNDGSAWLTPADNHHHVLRGGAWSFVPRYLRSAHRISHSPETRISTIGFRPAMDYGQ